MKYTSILKRCLLLALLFAGSHSFSQVPPPPVPDTPVDTIPAGDSIIIVYSVTIKAPPVGTSVTNQATISGNNFATFMSNQTVTPISIGPSISTGESSTPFIEGTAVVVDEEILVDNPNKPDFVAGTVSIGNFQAGDTLQFANQNDIVGVFDPLTGILSLTGTATIAEYRAALRSIIFNHKTDDPSATSRIISFQLNDDTDNSNTATKTITIKPVNDAPTLNAISGVNINEDAAQQTVNLSGITNVEASETLTVTATSDNTGLIPDPSVTYTSPNTTGSIAFTPVANASGSAIITVTVTDNGGMDNGGSNSFSRTFTVTVGAINDAPTLDAISGVNINEDAGAQSVDLTGIAAGATDESGQGLTVTATSDNTGLIPNPSVNYTSPNATGSLGFTPVANASGSAVITVTVTDNGGTDNGGVNTFSRTFTVTVGAVNDAPTLNAISGVNINEDAAQQTVNLSGITNVETSQTLTVTATSDNTGLMPNPSVTYTSPNATGSITFTPVANASGSAIITVTVTDNGGTDNGGANSFSRTFTVTVGAINDAPTLDAISGVNINEDAGAQSVDLTGIAAGATDESGQGLTVTATSDNTGLIPNPSVNYTSPNATGSLGFTPVANASGSAVITVTVTDNGGTANGGVNTFSRTFTVTVGAVNDAPTLDAIGGVNINEDAAQQTVNLSGITNVETSQTLTVTATSDNTGVIPNPSVTYTSPNTTGSIAFTPVANASGSAIISVTVTDNGGTDNGGSNSFSRTFTVTVGAINDVPVITTSTGSTLYVPSNPPVVVDNALVVADVDDTHIESAVVDVSVNFQSGDNLAFGTLNGISGNYNSATGVLTFTGSSTLANYQAALRSVTFNTTSSNTDDRTVRFIAFDGDGNSSPSIKVVKLQCPSGTDPDGDIICNPNDNCSVNPNADQADGDSDGVGNVCDNCPLKSNADQLDGDGDGKGNVCDNCPTTVNANQSDVDDDGVGDVCDNCPNVKNRKQANNYSTPGEPLDANGKDRQGDACDDTDSDGFSDAEDFCPELSTGRNLDSDNDGIGDRCDNCPNQSNPGQLNTDGTGEGDRCDEDDDDDGVNDAEDNCPKIPNKDQENTDNPDDTLLDEGDACDDDTDGDGVLNDGKDGIAGNDDDDNCPLVSNENQANNYYTKDGKATEGLNMDDEGDACDDSDGDDIDEDDDGVVDVPDNADNCVLVKNADQANDLGDDEASEDGFTGDACEDQDDDEDIDNADNCPTTPNADQANNFGGDDDEGDACDDTDDDGIKDGVADDAEVGTNGDNCPTTANFSQKDDDKDNVGDVCDNCPTTSNPRVDEEGEPADPTNTGTQPNMDGDDIGDVCDDDRDGDGIDNGEDNCPDDSNEDQFDTDDNGDGDACQDDDGDGDGVLDFQDNCPGIKNAQQENNDLEDELRRNGDDNDDNDREVQGDVCDEDDDNDGKNDDEDCAPKDPKERGRAMYKRVNGQCTVQCANNKRTGPGSVNYWEKRGYSTDPEACERRTVATTNPSDNIEAPAVDAVRPGLSTKVGVSIYPNPTSGSLKVMLQNFRATKAEIILMNAAGSVVERRSVSVGGALQTETFDLTRKAAGIYLVRVVSEDGVKTSKVVLQR